MTIACPSSTAPDTQFLKFSELDQLAINSGDNFHGKTDLHYAAYFLKKNPNICDYNIGTDNGEKCVIPVPDPELPSNASLLPAGNGFNDTALINNAVNSGGAIDGQGQTYFVNNVAFNTAVQLFNANIKPVAGASRILTVNAGDVLMYNVNIDVGNQASVYEAIRVNDNAHRFRFLKGSIRNIYHLRNDGTPFNTYGILLQDGVDPLIAGSTFENFVLDFQVAVHQPNSGVRVCRPIWMQGSGNNSQPPTRIFNNRFINAQANDQGENGESITNQGYIDNGTTHPVGNLKVFANYFEDYGKRALKIQQSGLAAYSNEFYDLTLTGPLPEPERRRLAVIASQLGMGNNWMDNNYFYMGPQVDRYEHFITWQTRQSLQPDNNSADCNCFEVDSVHDNPGGGGRFFQIFDRDSSGATSGLEPTNSTIDDNQYKGSGSVKAYYNTGGGIVDNMNWLLSFNNNQTPATGGVPFTQALIVP